MKGGQKKDHTHLHREDQCNRKMIDCVTNRLTDLSEDF